MDVTTLLRERQNKFIETRTLIASEVQKYLNSLNAMDAEVRAEILLPKGNTPQEILPALWVEPFDMEAYTEQLNQFQASVQSAKIYCDKLNQEALRCLQQ